MLAGWREKIVPALRRSASKTSVRSSIPEKTSSGRIPENQPELAMAQAPTSMRGRHTVGLTTYIRCLPRGTCRPVRHPATRPSVAACATQGGSGHNAGLGGTERDMAAPTAAVAGTECARGFCRRARQSARPCAARLAGWDGPGAAQREQPSFDRPGGLATLVASWKDFAPWRR